MSMGFSYLASVTLTTYVPSNGMCSIRLRRGLQRKQGGAASTRGAELQGERLMAFGGERDGRGDSAEVVSDAAVLDAEAALWVPLPMSGAASESMSAQGLTRSPHRV